MKEDRKMVKEEDEIRVYGGSTPPCKIVAFRAI